MGLTHIATVNNSAAGIGTTLDTSTTLNVVAGDVLVTAFLCHGNTGAWTVSIADTAGNNAHTMATAAEYNDTYVHIGYRLVGEADSLATIRVTSNNVSDRAMVVFQFRPDSGDILSFDVQSQGTANWSNAPNSGNITTTGDDEIVICGIVNDHGRTYTNQNIGGAAAGAVSSPTTDMFAMYTIYTAIQTAIAGTASMSDSGSWAASIISIKATAGAGANAPTGDLQGCLVGPLGGPIMVGR